MTIHSFIFILIFLPLGSIQAQISESELNEATKASSPFVVNPDPLDPLPSKKENIKDGDEIVLDNIKDIIDDKVKVKKKKIINIKSNKDKKSEELKENQISQVKPKVRKKNKTKKSKVVTNNDDPELKLELNLNSRYKKFNIEPTSELKWSQASSQQKVNVYEVHKNDTLFTISKVLFGDSQFWPKVWAVNRNDILNPHFIYPGMKIFFHSGDARFAPTISLGSRAKNDPLYYRQNTESRTELISNVSQVEKNNFPTEIPESLPLTKNNRYFFKDEKKTIFEIRDIQRNDEIDFVNSYILTSKEMTSDFSVPKKNLSGFICRENQYVGSIEKVNLSSVEGKYFLVKQLNNQSVYLKSTLKYKVLGEVVVSGEKNELRISSCSDLMDTETLLVSEEKITAVEQPTEIISGNTQIIDGFEYNSQQYFAENQFIVLNAESLNIAEGGTGVIYSDQFGKNIGQIKVLQRAGTLAIGVITQMSDLIQLGDLITE